MYMINLWTQSAVSKIIIVISYYLDGTENAIKVYIDVEENKEHCNYKHQMDKICTKY